MRPLTPEKKVKHGGMPWRNFTRKSNSVMGWFGFDCLDWFRFVLFGSVWVEMGWFVCLLACLLVCLFVYFSLSYPILSVLSCPVRPSVRLFVFVFMFVCVSASLAVSLSLSLSLSVFAPYGGCRASTWLAKSKVSLRSLQAWSARGMYAFDWQVPAQLSAAGLEGEAIGIAWCSGWALVPSFC